MINPEHSTRNRQFVVFLIVLLLVGVSLAVYSLTWNPNQKTIPELANPEFDRGGLTHVLTRISGDEMPRPLVASVHLPSPPTSMADCRQRLPAMIREARRRGARYICCPEPVFAGDPGSVRGESLAGPTTEFFGRLARELEIWLALAIFEQVSDEGPAGEMPFLTTVLIAPTGEVANHYRKVMVSDAAGSASRGDFRQNLHSIDDRGVRLGIMAGDDVQVGIPRLADRGAEIILIPEAWSEAEIDRRYTQCAELSAKYHVNLVVAGKGGGAIFLRDGTSRRGQSGPDPIRVAELPSTTRTWQINSALGLPETVPMPSYQRISPEIVELGRMLFLDTNLSSTGKVSCATCHQPEKAFSNGQRAGQGVLGRETARNVPTLLNVAFRPLLRWDGYASSLENFMKYPISGFDEMNFHYLDEATVYLRQQPRYVSAFRDVLGASRIEFSHVEIALAAYQRTLLSGNSAFDRYYYQGDLSALNDSARRGLELFTGKADCVRCHTIGPSYALFMDFQYHFTGVGYSSDPGSSPDLGLGGISTSDFDGLFQTPSLRDVALTAPYMHDGSMQTLEEVVEYLASGSNLNDRRVTLKRLSLTAGDKQDLVSFLKALTGDVRYNADGTPRSTVRADQADRYATVRK